MTPVEFRSGREDGDAFGGDRGEQLIRASESDEEVVTGCDLGPVRDDGLVFLVHLFGSECDAVPGGVVEQCAGRFERFIGMIVQRPRPVAEMNDVIVQVSM